MKKEKIIVERDNGEQGLNKNMFRFAGDNRRDIKNIDPERFIKEEDMTSRKVKKMARD